MKTRFIRKAYNAVEPVPMDDPALSTSHRHGHSTSTVGPYGTANGLLQRRSIAFAAFEDPPSGSSGSPSRKVSEEWLPDTPPSPPLLMSGGRSRRLSIATRGINVTVESSEGDKAQAGAEAANARASPSPQRMPAGRSRAGSVMSPSGPVLPQKRGNPRTGAARSAPDASVKQVASPLSTTQLIPQTTATPAPTAAPLPPSDQLSPELLGLLRVFRQAVEHAIVEGAEGSEGTNSVGLHSVRPPASQSASGLALPKYVGAELNQACNDVIRYVTQFLKHKKDEFEELLVRHVRWGQPTTTETEAQRAEREGPHHLASIYCILEALLVTSGCDRAILYIVNPKTNQLVGISYAGTQVPIEVPVLVPIEVKTEVSRTGGPERQMVHPAVVSYLNCAGINIASLQDCPPEIAVEAYDNLTGYATRNMLCVPIRDCGGSAISKAKAVGATSAPGADRRNSASTSRRRQSTSMLGNEDEVAEVDDTDPQVAVIGVIQLLNKHRTAPARHQPSGADNKKSSRQDDDTEDGASAPHMPFSDKDEVSAVHAASQIATILMWAAQAKVDFLSTSACKHSAQLQHMHSGIRQRARGDISGLGATTTAAEADNPTAILSQIFAGGARKLTISGDKLAKAHQSARDQAIRDEVREGICGDVLDAVEASVIKSTAEGLMYGSVRGAPQQSEGPKGASIGNSKAAPRRPGTSANKANTNISAPYSPKATLARNTATATEMVQALSDRVFSVHKGVPTATKAGQLGAKGGKPLVTMDDTPLVIHRISNRKITLLEDGDVVGGLITGLGGGKAGQPQPTIMEAAQAMGHLKGAWKHVHAQLSLANGRLATCQRQLEAERLRCRTLEGACRRAGIESVVEEALAPASADGAEASHAPINIEDLLEANRPSEPLVAPHVQRMSSPHPLVPDFSSKLKSNVNVL